MSGKHDARRSGTGPRRSDHGYMVRAYQLPMREIGQGLHVDAHRKGYASLSIVGNTLVSIYGKCNALVEAEYAFDRLCNRTLVSWNAMFSTYVECGHGKRALQLLKKMQEDGIIPDAVTFLMACLAPH